MARKKADERDEGIPRNLFMVRDSLGLKGRQVAKAMGVNYQTYSRYERGISSPGSERIRNLIALGINPAFILSGKGDIKISNEEIQGPGGGDHEDGELAIPRGDIRVAALVGLADQQRGVLRKDVVQVIVELFWPWVIDQFGQSFGKLKTFVMNSDNMEPLIRKGDLLIIDASILEIREDGIYAFTIGGRIKIKRVFEGSDNMIAISNVNRDYETDVLKTSRESLVKPASGEEKLHVEGKVIKILKNP